MEETMKRTVPVLAVALLALATSASADDKADVVKAMEMWQAKLGEACSRDASHILPLYAKDGVLWGTISTTIRSDPAGLADYFVNACKKLPKLTVAFHNPLIRIYGDAAVNSGSYTFSFEKDGQMTELPARYSFTLVKRDGQWLIVDHHSSAMPK
jgi:uncharacterized protein (TIGR02246 family)